MPDDNVASMNNPARKRRPNGSPPRSVKSVRCSNAAWERAAARAASEGVTMAYVLNVLVEGYGARHYDLPKVTVTFGA